MKKLDRFRIGEALGQGGAGAVYKAEEELPGGALRTVALKILPALGGDKGAAGRFYEEARAVAMLTGHGNVVTFYSMGISEQIPWLAMEYVPGNLGQLAGDQPAGVGEVWRMMVDVALGLEFMHTREPCLLHNDLKPANILVDSQGRCKLTDFGLASLVAMDRTHVLATVRYAAPELLSREFGKVCPATDLYALGHIAYEYALGGRLYRGQFPAVYDDRTSSREAPPAKWMAWHCSLPTVAPAVQDIIKEFPRGLSDVIAKLMHKPLEGRYAGAADVLADLRKLQTGETQPGDTTAGSAGRKSPAMTAAGMTANAGGLAGGMSDTMAAGAKYFLRLRGRVTGPYDLATLQKQARQGVVSRLHQVSEDQVTWKAATAVAGLFGG